MCKFKSMIVGKDKTVYWLLESEHHDDIIEYFNLNDYTDNADEMLFARVEISPPESDPFASVDEWNFKIDERIIPTWFSPAHEMICRQVIKDNYKKIIKNVEIDCDKLTIKLPDDLEECGNINLRNYSHPLPNLKKCGNINLRNYSPPLPNLKKCGNITLQNYKYPLPSLMKCRDIYIYEYEYQLSSLVECKNIFLDGYGHTLPSLKKCDKIYNSDNYIYAEELLKQLGREKISL